MEIRRSVSVSGNRFFRGLIFAASFCFAFLRSGSADEKFDRSHVWLHFDGLTYHFDAPGANSLLWGSGLTWYHKSSLPMLTAWEGDAFEDSERHLAAYLGHSWAIPFKYFNFGATAALMYHHDFASQNKYLTLPVVIPFLETHGRSLKLRIYYVPPVRNPTDQQVAAQLLLLFR